MEWYFVFCINLAVISRPGWTFVFGVLICKGDLFFVFCDCCVFTPFVSCLFVFVFFSSFFFPIFFQTIFMFTSKFIHFIFCHWQTQFVLGVVHKYFLFSSFRGDFSSNLATTGTPLVRYTIIGQSGNSVLLD